MKKTILISILATLFLLNPSAAQSGEIQVNCGSSQNHGILQPGDERSCIVEGFPSDFEWGNYTYEWSVTPGEVKQRSIESVNLQAPYNTSADEVTVEVSMTDGSSQVYTTETSIKLEKQDENTSEDEHDSADNESFQLPVEDPEENQSKEKPELTDFKLTCKQSVKAGQKARCSAEFSREPQTPSYEWEVEGRGEIEGDERTGIYRAPEKLEETRKAQIKLTTFSSTEKVSDSETIRLVRVNTDNEEEKIENQTEKIREQRKKIEQLKSTINGLRSRINELEEEIGRLEEYDTQEDKSSDSQENESFEGELPGWENSSSENNSRENLSEKSGDDSDIPEETSEEAEESKRSEENQRFRNESSEDSVNETKNGSSGGSSLFEALTSLLN